MRILDGRENLLIKMKINALLKEEEQVLLKFFQALEIFSRWSLVLSFSLVWTGKLLESACLIIIFWEIGKSNSGNKINIAVSVDAI